MSMWGDDLDLRRVPFEIRRASEAGRQLIDGAKKPLTVELILDAIVVFDCDRTVVCRLTDDGNGSVVVRLPARN